MVLSSITHSDGRGIAGQRAMKPEKMRERRGAGDEANGAGRGRREEEGTVKGTERRRGSRRLWSWEEQLPWVLSQ